MRLEKESANCVIREWNLKNTMFVTFSVFLQIKREILLLL